MTEPKEEIRTSLSPTNNKNEEIKTSPAEVKIEKADDDDQNEQQNEHSEEEGEIDEGTAIAAMTHTDAMHRFRDGLAEIIIGDPLLSDLHTAVTLGEVTSQIALEYGQAMTVNIRRFDDIVLPIVVVQSATVQDLKHAIQRAFVLKQKREDGTLHISWRYVWKTYYLYFNGVKLTEAKNTLKSYGIRNKDEVTFLKRLRRK